MQMGGWRNAHGEGRKMYNLLGTHTYRDKTEVHIKVVPTKKRGIPISLLHWPFWVPGGHFRFCNQCGVAGSERVYPFPLDLCLFYCM